MSDKRYMDFVSTKSVDDVKPYSVPTKKTSQHLTTKATEPGSVTGRAMRPSVEVSSIQNKSSVKSTSGMDVASASKAKELKAQKISRMPVLGRAATREAKTSSGVAATKPNINSARLSESKKAGDAKQGDKKTLKLPKVAFLNTDKITKRPLSRNVYQKNLAVPKEVPSAPVTIIDKPEKDSKVGLIVTVIVTIVLGAAAGTVAFLLLPK